MNTSRNLESIVSETYLDVKALRAEVQELIQRLEKPTPASVWMNTTKAYQPLGLNSVATLRRLIREGVFSAAKGEIRNISMGNRNTWQLNIPKCEKRLEQYFKKG